MPQSDAETAYPCGFEGSPKIEECHVFLPAGVPYCGRFGPVAAPFADCKIMLPDLGEQWAWYCCPNG